MELSISYSTVRYGLSSFNMSFKGRWKKERALNLFFFKKSVSWMGRLDPLRDYDLI